MRTRAARIERRRLALIGAGIVGVGVALGVVRYVVRAVAPQLMEQMATKVMPGMMDACFGQMPEERRTFMLTHCRTMLDRIDEKYKVTRPAEQPSRPVEVA
jgi:hypothetical protein